MNRADRRKVEQGKMTTHYTTEHHKSNVNLNELIEKIKLEATRDTLRVIMSVMAVALNDEYGFGTVRTQKLIDRMRKQLECIASGHVKATDILQWCIDKDIKLL